MDPVYDVFLSYASEDRAWCERLAERLRDEGVHVWADFLRIQPGDHLEARLNEGLEQSRKLIALFSKSYFREDKHWTLAESYSTQHANVLAQERPLIPVLIEECTVKPTLRSLVHLDFRSSNDFELRFRQLVQALDLPRPEPREPDTDSFPLERELSRSDRGRAAHRGGKRFEDEVAALYRLLGYEVTQDMEIAGVQIDLQIQRFDGLRTQAIVECKQARITAEERNQIIAQQAVVKQELPKHRWVAVGGEGFAADTRAALEKVGFDCFTYRDLLRELVPLDRYVENLIAEHENWVNDPDGWKGADLYIRPDIETDITYERQPAFTHLGKWLGDPRRNLLVLLGDLGTGKTTLARRFSHELALRFREDPLRHPAPVLIPLREVRKDVTLETIVVKHFRDRGLPDVSFPRFEHLVRLGKVVLLFDAFDEMADRVRLDTTLANFQELRRAAEGAGKVLLSCRTHYFKDRTEQAKVIGEGPSLTAAETALYKELRSQSSAEVVYLQEFDDEKIRAYLLKARGAEAEADWEKIQAIYNLRDLAQRPLLLDMIVKSIPRLQKGEQINASRLYTVYTAIWAERDFKKGRVVLDQRTKLALMSELAWRMWADERDEFSTQELVQFIGRLHSGKALEFGDEEVEDITREVQTASFLRRDRKGGTFTFMHRSFGEFFLARKLFEALGASVDKGRAVLNTRRIDQKVAYFLTLLDEKDAVCAPLQEVLQGAYTQKVSENALQLLYWSGRIRCGMEEKVTDLQRLRRLLTDRVPAEAQLAGAQLQGFVLEGASFVGASFAGADLTKVNLTNVAFRKCDLSSATLRDARAERLALEETDVSGINIEGAVFPHAARPAIPAPAPAPAPAPVEETAGAQETEASRDLLPAIQHGSPQATLAVAWSPDGALLAVGCQDDMIRLYRARDGRLLRVLEGHSSSVLSIAFDPAGRTLASGSDDSTVKLWDTASGRLLRTLEGHSNRVWSVAFEPTGRTLASGSSDYTVKLWDTASGRLIRTLAGHSNRVLSVAFEPTGPALASGSDRNTIKLWDAASGRLIRSLGQWDRVRSIAFDPTGRTLASGSDDNTIKLWDVASGKLIGTLQGHSNRVWSVAFERTGRTLASGSDDKTIKLWDTASGKLIHTLKGHSNSVRSVAFEPTGRTLASGSDDNTIKLWDTLSGKLIRTLEEHSNRIWSFAFEPTGRALASGSDDNTINLWDTASGKLIRTLDGYWNGVWSVAYEPTGRTLACGSDDCDVKLWDTASGKLIRTPVGHAKRVRSVAFEPTGRRLASGSDDNTIKLWDAVSGNLIHTLVGHLNRIWSLAFDPTGHTLASGSDDCTVKLWETASGRFIRTLEGHSNGVLSVAFDPTGRALASGSDDNTVKLWDSDSGRLLRTSKEHSNSVRSVAFEPAGLILASGSDDNTVKLWDTASGNLIRTLAGHAGPVLAVRFDPQGRYLVAAGMAGRLQFWDFQRGVPFLFLESFGPGAWLALLPDGRFDGTPEALRYLCYTRRDSFESFTAEEVLDTFHKPKAVQEVLAKYNVPLPSPATA